MFVRNTEIVAWSAVSLVILCGSPAAHVVLETVEAPASSYHKAVFRVPHGCDGAATTAIRIAIPEGILVAKPQPKPGWDVAVERHTLAEPAAGPHGSTITEIVTEIAWTGGLLADHHFDEFAIQVRLPDSGVGETLYFPVVQECTEGVHRWVEIPEAGATERPRSPAPALRLTGGS